MTFEDDPDLERRLRRIAADPKPEAPASVYRMADEVASGDRKQRLGDVVVTRFRPPAPRVRRRADLRQLAAVTGIAAALVIAVSLIGVLRVGNGPGPGATWTVRPDAGGGEWTGLEWHDITSTAGGMFWQNPWWMGGGSGPGGIVTWRGGYALVGQDLTLWLSKDGLTWARAAGAPSGGVIGVGGDLLVDAIGAGYGQPTLWLSADGISWSRVSAPFDVSTIWSYASTQTSVVFATTADRASQPPGSFVLYATDDAKTWTRATLPSDMAQARQISLSPFIGGFVAIGLLLDPNGSIGYGDDAGNMTHYSERAWRSRDGISWAAYGPFYPDTSAQGTDPWTGMQTGRLGAGDGRMYSTDGGATWLLDHDRLPSFLSGIETVSDGDRIVMAAQWGARFYLSEGDGHWRLLEQGGDIGSLPGGGQAMLLPNGVLWIAGSRVFFGQALSGVAPRGSLAPSTTGTPEPNSYGTPAAVLATSTPVEMATSTPALTEPATPASTQGVEGSPAAPSSGSSPGT
jgi:hypothetical protein